MQHNLAARAGRWSAQHRKPAILGWLAFVIIATVAGGAIGQKQLDDADTGNGQSRVADEAIAAAGFPEQTDEQVLVQGVRGARAGEPQTRSDVRDVVRRLRATAHVSDVRSPLHDGDEGLVSRDGRSVLVTFKIAGEDEAASDRVAATLAATAAAARANPDVRIAQFGGASADKALSKAFARDFQRAEYLSLPITLLILIVAFGALVAAGLPLLLAVTAVMGTIGLLGPISQLVPLDESISSVVLLVGLAIGVDYCMFYLRREMEERDAGRSPEAALNAAAATSGRAVLVSGLTVMVAMVGMFLAGNAVFESFAIGTILAVAVAIVGSLKVLPAMLSFLGQKGWTEKGRVPYVSKLRHRTQGESRVERDPLAGAGQAGRLDRDRRWADGDARAARAGAAHDQPGPRRPAALAADHADLRPHRGGVPRRLGAGRRHRPGRQRAGARRSVRHRGPEGRGRHDPRPRPARHGHHQPRNTLAIVDIPLAGDGTDDASEAALAHLREDVIPQTMGAGGAQVNVTGMTAGSKDFNDTMKSHLPLVFGFVLGLTFLLLLVTLRSIVIPAVAIVLNLLSVGASYGVLKLVFQDGHGEGLLGFESTAGPRHGGRCFCS